MTISRIDEFNHSDRNIKYEIKHEKFIYCNPDDSNFIISGFEN